MSERKIFKKKQKSRKKELDFNEYTKYFELMARKKKKSKMGRPPLKAKDKRAAMVTLRLKKAERDQLEREAGAKGLSLSSYLKLCWQKARAKK